MSGVRLFMILVLLPALVALGHDVYLFYINEGVNSVANDVMRTVEDKGTLSLFASLGYIWTQYDPEGYKTIAQSLDEETWTYINTLLTYKAVFVGLAFAGFFYVILAILKLLGAWPFRADKAERFGTTTRTDEIMGKKKKKIKYKRK